MKECSRPSERSLEGRERKHEDIILSVLAHVGEDRVKKGKCEEPALFWLGLDKWSLKKIIKRKRTIFP